MQVIGILLTCLIVGLGAVVLACLLFYGIIILLSKVADVIDIGCGCFGLIFVGFLVLLVLGLFSYIF